MSFRYHIGIDPDIKESGVAIWDSYKKCFDQITTLEFFDVIDTIKMALLAKIHIEAAWMHDKTIYARLDSKSIYTQVRIAKDVGANRQTGKFFEDYCRRINIPYQLHQPTTSKLNAESFKKLTRWEKSTNSEKRDAAMLVFGL